MIQYRSVTLNRESRKRPKLSHLVYEKGDDAILWVRYGFSINDAESIDVHSKKETNILSLYYFLGLP